ncbi:MAG: Abi-alpha family protein [Nocardioides sp.]|uniref:Abi-alpha family protein n=1 Tax=Nocardioides sp. TaxID=35761 RepID=UPI003265467B
MTTDYGDRDEASSEFASSLVDESVFVPEPLGPRMTDVPGLARLAASTWLHGTEWGLMTSGKVAGRLARATTDREEAQGLLKDVGKAAHVISDVTRSLSAGESLPVVLAHIGDSFGELTDPVRAPGQQRSTRLQAASDQTMRRAPSLRERGSELLERSRDVWSTESGHPAYARILEELAPDEARVLVLLLRGGPQPSVDVRTGGAVGMVSSTLVKPGLTMIGPRAGCRYLDQVPSYLHNLFRLGLVWFSRELVTDPMEYQVLEAQPDVIAAMKSVRHAKVLRRSISLTPFGDDFCRTVLVDPADGEALPAHPKPEV